MLASQEFDAKHTLHYTPHLYQNIRFFATAGNKAACHVFHRIKFIASERWRHFSCMQAKSFITLTFLRTGTFAAALNEQLARLLEKCPGNIVRIQLHNV